MLRVIILSLLYIGSANVHSSGDYKRIIKKAVKNKDRQSAIISKIEEFRSPQVAFENEIEAQIGVFQDIYDNDNLSHDRMDEYFDEIEQMYTQYYLKRVDARMELADFLTEKEWDKIYGLYKKNHGKIQEARRNRFAYLDAEVAQINEAFDASIENQEDLVLVKESVENIRLIFHKFYTDSNNINFVDNPVLGNQSSTKEEVQGVFDQWDKDRAQFYGDLINETRKMSDYLDNQEWDSFLEQLKKEFE